MHPQRLRSFDYRGFHRYFLTFCTAARRQVFVTQNHVDAVRTQILRAAAQERFEIVAYAFMPDHVHLLIEGLSESSDGSRFIKLAKQLAGYHYQRTFGDRLWQRYGYEHTLRGDEATIDVVRYIIENPVRAGLVDDVQKYAFLGSTKYGIADLIEAVQMGSVWRPTK